jgi:hypothetical protein
VKRWDLVVGLGVVGAVLVAFLGTFSAVTACNSGGGSCPDKAGVVPGGSCSDDKLQCAFDLMTPAVACDGTTATIETSCTCTDGTWACPSAVECDSGTAEEAGEEAGSDEAGSDEASTDDGGTEASTEDAADAGDAHDD